jgi:hypothetical protein
MEAMDKTSTVETGRAGGKARAKKLTPEERSDSARKAAQARWAEKAQQLGLKPKPRRKK